jgi:DNA-binding protein HU-beta
MAEKIWLRIPPDEILRDRTGWHRIDDSTYLAIRSRVLVVKERGRDILKGPPRQVIEHPQGTRYSLEHKTVKVEKFTESIQDSIQTTMELKLTEELATKIGAQIGANGAILSSALSNEVQQKCGTELTEAIQRGLAGTKSHEVQYTNEETHSVTYQHQAGDNGARSPLVLYFYLGLWPWKWTVYLIKVDFLRLQYKRRWFWRDVRKSISQGEIKLELPLFQVLFYEPQTEWSISEGSYHPEIADEDEIKIVSVDGRCPAAGPPRAPDLEDLARLAFPVTKVEKKSTASKNAQLLRTLAKASGVSSDHVRQMLDTLANTAVKEVRDKGVFVLPGIGRLVRSDRKQRMGRNPQTGAAIKIPSRKVVQFRVAKECNDAIAARASGVGMRTIRQPAVVKGRSEAAAKENTSGSHAAKRSRKE